MHSCQREIQAFFQSCLVRAVVGFRGGRLEGSVLRLSRGRGPGVAWRTTPDHGLRSRAKAASQRVASEAETKRRKPARS